MKLSQFKNKGNIRKLSFIDGILVESIQEEKINGDITVYYNDLDLNKMLEMKDLIDKVNEDEYSDNMFMYSLIPYLCDVEVDITFEEFEEISNNPSSAFTQFLNLLISVINKMVEDGEKVSIIIDKSNELKKVVEESNEEKLSKLYDKLPKATSKEEKLQILKEIQELEYLV